MTHEWKRELSVTQLVNGDNAIHRWGSNPHNTRGKDQCDRWVQQGLGVTYKWWDSVRHRRRRASV